MKKILVLLACLGITASSLALASTDEKLNPMAGSLVKIESVSATVKTAAGMVSTMHVEAIATFSNECTAPASEKELIATTQTEKDNITYNVTLLQLNTGRFCTTEYKPVQKTVVIADIRITDGQPLPLILPQFTVNGVKASVAGQH